MSKPADRPSGGSKGVAKPRVATRPSLLPVEEGTPPAEWGSLLADLSSDQPGRAPVWRIHDRTHLEFALDYDLSAGRARHFEWDVYFFVPKSLRLHEGTYDKGEIYEDLQSYVRYAVPDVSLDELALAPVERLRQALHEGDDETALRELRLFACLVRASGVRAQRAIVGRLTLDPPELDLACAAAVEMTQAGRALTSKLREVLTAMRRSVPERDEALVEAARWVDEDVSKVLETLLANLAIELRQVGASKDAAREVAAGAVEQARYRRAEGLDGVGHAGDGKQQVEHLEFRRHVLKRFTSSVLWLKLEVRQAATVAKHTLYAIAAAAAMAFALVAAFWNGTNPYNSGNFWLWITLAVLGYAGKDRIKAGLQQVFASYLSKRFPDRKWRVFDRERGVTLGRVEERSGFVHRRDIPEGVSDTRYMGRRHDFEDDSRPERVLWHHKSCTFDGRRVAAADERFTAITEIFRLNVSRWLEHTDDPKRKIVFADPDDWHIYSAVAPRVYNIAVVYRLRTNEDAEGVWHRLRIVVTRKGIVRIDRVS